MYVLVYVVDEMIYDILGSNDLENIFLVILRRNGGGSIPVVILSMAFWMEYLGHLDTGFGLYNSSWKYICRISLQ